MKVMIRIHNSVMHLMVKAGDLFGIFSVSKNGRALIANSNELQSSKENEVDGV